jgi:Glycosyltransferase family 28 C-terminal domain
VPLPHGNGEQRLNALPVERAGGGLIIDDASLSPGWIRSVLLGILLDHELVASMSRAASSIGNRDADVRLARQVLAIADGAVTDGAGVHGTARHATADRAVPGTAMPGRSAADRGGWRAGDGRGAAEDETTEGGAGRNGRHRGSHRGRGQ